VPAPASLQLGCCTWEGVEASSCGCVGDVSLFSHFPIIASQVKKEMCRTSTLANILDDKHSDRDTLKLVLQKELYGSRKELILT
jgi:hypothetical protein